MKKHAFLIIAHNNFLVLSKLLDALSHPCVDIYLHIDAKVKQIPAFNLRQSQLYILQTRIDTRWGDFSQIETEYVLMETALRHGGYAFYHIISGTHFPLLPIERILDFFNAKEGQTVFHALCTDTQYQEFLKVRSYNLFTRYLAFGPKAIQKSVQILNRAGHKVQSLLGIERNRYVTFYKASNWASFSEEAILMLIERKEQVRHIFAFSYCGDEYFAPTVLMNSPLREQVSNYENYLKLEMGDANPRTLTDEDYDMLIHSNCLFARKFSDANISLVDKITRSYPCYFLVL
jgi:hypothetical protein